MKNVEMVGGVTYDGIDSSGLRVIRDSKPEIVAADCVILCAGQVPERALAEQLKEKGVDVHVIGGADVAAELDAKRAIDQGARLAASL
jgi:2,4-dienoyl-CoA reductase (NADPH2)